MSLSSWLDKHQISYEVCGGIVTRWLLETGEKRSARRQIRGSTVRRWALPNGHRDKRNPREPYIRALYAISGGEVDPTGLIDLPEITASMQRRVAELLDEAKRAAAVATHAGRAKGARVAAKSRGRVARAKAGAR